MSSVKEQAKAVLHERQQAESVSAKRQAWNALQQHCPEFVPTFRAFCDRLGCDALVINARGEEVARWEKK